MRAFSVSSLLVAAFAALAAAQANTANPFKIPTQGLNCNAGQATTITWNPTTSGTVTLKLREGAMSNLNKGTTIASSIPNSGSYTWTPPTDTVRNSDYALEIVDDTDPTQVNYTPQFVIESSNTVASASSSSASASASASATSAAASSSSSAASSSAASSSSMTSSAASSSSTSAASSSASSSSASASSASSSAASSTLSTATKSASATAHSATASATSAPNSSAAGLKVSGFGAMVAIVVAAFAL